MSQGQPILSSQLRRARRFLDGHQEMRLLDDWTWFASSQRWGLRLCLSPTTVPATTPLHETIWYVLAESLYPWGSIAVFPARTGGIEETYPHQNANGPGETDVPWRLGKLCLSTDHHILGRHGADDEPMGQEGRLRWHLERALDWIVAAHTNTLQVLGDPFETPDLPLPVAHMRLGFSETDTTFAQWSAIPCRSGSVRLIPMRPRSLWLTHTFARSAGGLSLLTAEWGSISTMSTERETGVWLKLHGLPILPPWQLPRTWGELCSACAQQGDDVEALLRDTTDVLRDGQRHLLLLGCPIPDTIGAAPCRVHWLAICLPALSHGSQAAKGFRPQRLGYWLRDKQEILTDDAVLSWVPTDNWAPENLAARGQLPVACRSRRIAMIGVGALGSAVAELLARGGCRSLTLIDGDIFKSGNMVRHTLTALEVGLNKAEALALHLRMVAPQAQIEAIPTNFPPTETGQRSAIQACDCIIDTTGDDSVLERMAVFDWAGEKDFLSPSLGYLAQRLWCFHAGASTFPHHDFDRLMAPWLRQDAEEHPDRTFPREGVGCWHPVFPARADDITLFAAIAVKYLARALMPSSTTPSLTVYTQCDEEGQFLGVYREGNTNAD